MIPLSMAAIVAKATTGSREQAKWARVPLVVALSFAVYRLFNQDLAPLIADEPVFLRSARDQVFSGHWVSASPLVGNQGLHYGPTILWFYGLLYELFGSGPAPQFLTMTLLVTASNVCASLAIGRYFMPRSQLSAALVALVASSPYHFIWSRLCWDQSVEILSGCTVAVLCTNASLRPGRAAVAGVFMGFALSSHLMVTLFVIFIGLFLLSCSTRWWRLVNPGVYGMCILAINIPYLQFLAKGPKPNMPPGAPLTAEAFMTCLLEPLRVATTKDVSYFFDSEWPAFVKAAGIIGHLPDYDFWQWFVLMASFAALIWLAVKVPRQYARFAVLAATFWVGYSVFLAQRNLARHPHYQFPSWWVVPAGVAALLTALSMRDRGLYRLGLCAVWGLAVLQMGFVIEWMSYIRERGGTRGIHYGATLAEQVKAVREACRREGDRVVIEPHIIIFRDSIEYLASALKDCDGKSVSVSATAAGTRVRLEYADSVSAHLIVR